MDLQRILVPVDFSESSAGALRHAVELAVESGGSLIIVHVVPSDYGWLGIGRDESRDLDRSLQRQAANRLEGLADEHVDHKVVAELEVRIGQPATQIAAAATDSKCNLIVMATHGLTGLDRYLIGSVADRVARLAPCPVLLIPPVRRPIVGALPSQTVLRFKHKPKRGR
ncbi:MAG: universal stress protein [Candidatus Udaeobacter sp.]